MLVGNVNRYSFPQFSNKHRSQTDLSRWRASKVLCTWVAPFYFVLNVGLLVHPVRSPSHLGLCSRDSEMTTSHAAVC